MEESWLKNYWRPIMAIQYTIVCLYDFVIAPTMTMIFHYLTNTPYTQWDSLTLKESGFYHMAMGIILGVAAYTRGQEKIQKIIMGENETVKESEK